nr:hypothetical protein MarFTME_388 [Marseillevirus futianmevirus]
MDSEHLFSTIHVVIVNDKCVFWSRDKEDAKVFAKAQFKDAFSEVDIEAYATFPVKEEDEWTLYVQERGFLWNGSKELYTKITIQSVDSVCDKV